MSKEKQLLRWEKHYSDGSVEYTDEESTKNLVDNLACADSIIVSRSYLKMKPVEWHTREQNCTKHSVMQGLPLKDWTTPVNGIVNMPDELDKLFNSIGMQLRFYTISNVISEQEFLIRTIWKAQKFFHEMYGSPTVADSSAGASVKSGEEENGNGTNV